MPPKSKSQWDFSGELFPAQEMRRVFSVSEITGTVRQLLEERVGTVWVTGEVSNLRAQSSGHIYFSLKDANAQLTCVCFRDDARSTRDLLQDGRKVVLKGDMTVYEIRGQYQLIVQSVELEGVGALQVAFEKLKQKLAAEGLFASERKRPIPELVQRLGLVTSPTGAAIHDVLHVIERRHPSLEIIFVGCRVQGQGAADEIAGAIRALNEWAAKGHRLDAILVTRGGGSLEDLWAFNEEVVAHAIFHSRVPIVSAVGHEIDFTIGDFVADLRAATPSAAAELLTEGMMRRREWVAQSAAQLFQIIRDRLAAEREHLDRLASRLARTHPRRHLKEQAQRLDELQLSLGRCARKEVRRHQLVLWNFAQRLARVKPSRSLSLRKQVLAELARRLHEDSRHALDVQRQRLREMETRLRLLSPEHVLERGFSITRDAVTGAVLRDVSQIEAGQKLKTKLHRGEITSVAEQTRLQKTRRRKD
ncbi:MAG TPA: exodeoxyribonuclease VII large subunit [Candidatus Limnocylindria bacterium]|nr:exodeoxyribonuclease VII large subunit [Candidatus Limnocylindria bacterium]